MSALAKLMGYARTCRIYRNNRGWMEGLSDILNEASEELGFNEHYTFNGDGFSWTKKDVDSSGDSRL